MARVLNASSTDEFGLSWTMDTTGVQRLGIIVLRSEDQTGTRVLPGAVRSFTIEATSPNGDYGIDLYTDQLALPSGYYVVRIEPAGNPAGGATTGVIDFDDGSSRVTSVSLSQNGAGRLEMTWQSTGDGSLPYAYVVRLLDARGNTVAGSRTTVQQEGNDHVYTFPVNVADGVYQGEVFSQQSQDIVLRSTPVTVSAPKVTKTLTIKDAKTGAPIAGAIVRQDSQVLGVADAEGRAVFAAAVGSKIEIVSPNYIGRPAIVGEPAAAETTLTPGAGSEAPTSPVKPDTAGEQAAAPRRVAVPVALKDLVQHQSAMPVCRVHVYQKGEKVPYHWAGPVRHPRGEAPSSVLGKDGWEGTPDNLSRWQVLSARTNESRQWSCSSAQFQLAHPMNAIEVPRIPPVRPNDLIVIEMGYVKGMSTRVNGPDGNTEYAAPYGKGNFTGDVVFYGKVDEVKDRGGSGEADGCVFTVSARCMMSHLVGNKIRCHYLPDHKGPGYNRAYVIRDLILRGAAIDYVEWEGDSTDIGNRRAKLTGARTVQPAKFVPNNCYLNIGKLEVSHREDLEPAQGGTPGIVIMDRFPLDLIKHFSLVETEPRELWADRRTGEIHWQARRTDARRLLEPASTHFRQYFYRYPVARANIISYTNEWTTAATVTHFTMTNPLAANSGSKQTAQVYGESPQALLIDPHTGEPLRRMTANRFVYDDTLVATETDNKAATILTALFSIWGRAIETGMVMVPGDPTLEIGEAVQIFNTGLFGRRYWDGGRSNGHAAGETNPSKMRTDDVGYADDAHNPEGVYRVEAVTNLFALGGVSRGYTTVFIFGPADPPTKVTPDSPQRLITSDADYNDLEWINPEDMAYNHEEAPR